MSSCLEQWALQGQEELTQLPLPPATPVMLQGFLEELRDTHGSQAVFFGGRVDCNEEMLLDGFDAPFPGVRALFYWMGNITTLIFAGEMQYKHLGDVQNDKNRWSTAKGPQGKLSARALTLKTLDRIFIYTDGLGAVGAELGALNEYTLQTRIQELLALSATDDRTILDLRWGRASALESFSEKTRHDE